MSSAVKPDLIRSRDNRGLTSATENYLVIRK